MYRLIIADDEHCIRENLATLVHWEGLGFQVVGQASNGREVLAMLDRLHPDVLLLDIKMPHMTGLDVALHVHANKLPIRTVLLSGFQEFELAKDAANYGVFKYLLKPTKLDDIQTTFRQLKQLLDEEKESSQAYERMLSAYHDSLRMLRYQTLHDLLYLPKPETLLERIQQMQPPLFLPSFCLFYISFENLDSQLAEKWHYERDLFDTLLMNVARNAGKRMHVSLFPMDSGSYLVVANGVSDAGFPSFRERLREELERLVGSVDVLKMGEPFAEVQQLRQEFVRFVPHAAYISDVENEGLVMTALVEGDVERLDVLLQAVLLDKPEDQRPAVIARLHAHIQHGLRDMGMPPPEGNPPTDEASMSAWMRDMAGKWKAWTRDSSSAEMRIVQRIKAFMQEHLADDLSLRRVAEHVYLSPVYVSRLFKQATGENFIDALKRMRVDKACQLLRNPDMRVYEIAQATGYNSSKYFMKVFKEYTRTTPTEYRKRLYGWGEDE